MSATIRAASSPPPSPSPGRPEKTPCTAKSAAMAGKTKLIIGLVHNKFVHLPIAAVTSKRNYVYPEGSLWRDCLDATGQPVLMVNDKEAFLRNSKIQQHVTK